MASIISVTGGRVTKFELNRAEKNLPQSLFCEENRLPSHRPPRLLSAQGYAPSLESSFSGITYHLARAALLTRHMEGCFSLYSSGQQSTSVKLRGALWKAARLLSRQKSKGFKFTSNYVDDVWPKYIDHLAGVTLISNFQLYGREFFKRRKQLDIGAYFYIDGTLTEYFESYDDFEVSEIDSSTKRRAIEVEREGYEAADGIAVFSRLTAHTLQHRYGLPAAKISVVLPGANLLDEAVDAIEVESASAASEEFVLGFVGLYPIRKGLDVLPKRSSFCGPAVSKSGCA